MNIMALLNALPGSIAQGLIWGVFAIGVYITFKVLDFADMTVDGSIATGGSVAVMMMLSGHNVAVALVAATIVGMLAGMVTGIFHVALGIPVFWQVSCPSWVCILSICVFWVNPIRQSA